MSVAPDENPDRVTKRTADAAGLGGGTLLAVVANQLPPDSHIKPLLLWAAPSVSFLLSALWRQTEARLTNYLREKEVATAVRKAEDIVKSGLADPTTRPEHRERLLKEQEGLRMLMLRRQRDLLKDLRVVSADDLDAPANVSDARDVSAPHA